MNASLNLIYFLALIATTQSCSSSKVLFREGKLLEVRSIAVQKIVPGIPNSSSFDQLLVQVGINESELNLDSVYYQNRVYFFKTTSTKELILNESSPCSDKSYTEDLETAVIFYHVQNKNYYQTHGEVPRLSDLVMP